MRKHLDLLFSCMVAITAFQFYYVWIEGLGYPYLHDVVYSLEERPYVYRMLIPFLSRMLEFLIGVSAVYWMILLVVASAVGLYFSLKYLYSTFESNNERTSIISFIICEILFIIILLTFPHIYDISTAMFFAFALALLARGKLTTYLILFPLATLNRETTFLLTVFWLIYFSKRIPVHWLFYGAVYQAIVYVVIRLAMTSAFAHLPGNSFDWQPMRNLEKFLASPLTTCLLLSALGIILYMVIAGWSQKPLFLRIAFLTLFPMQVFLHLTLGGAWELRVYAESLPVIFLLAAYAPILSRIAPVDKSR
jgi:hypothetical protein